APGWPDCAMDKFNLKCHFNAMETISMLEIRRNAKGLVERLGRGESFRITYRNRTVGELFPRPSLSTSPLALRRISNMEMVSMALK
ncbi:MAG: hypothetical protein ACKO39_03790, partial [Chthoniobacterales bacterium]